MDPARDPDGYTLAEVTLARFHTHVGVERRTQGERATDLASNFQRYLLPHALEFDAAQPHAGVGRLRLQHAKKFVTMTSGAAPLPAATVAGDLLGRTGLSCTWLTLTDAATACDGGLPALHEAIARGAVTPVTADGVELIRPVALRLRADPLAPGAVFCWACGCAARVVAPSGCEENPLRRFYATGSRLTR